jgi:uncharacterized protein YbaP (TraB family)
MIQRVVLRLGAAVCAALLAFSPACAQNRGTLFKATADGNTMYLFGTMHLTNPDHYPTEPVLMSAIEHAPALYVETIDQPGFAHLVFSVFSLFQEPTYKALSPDFRQRLSKQLKRARMSEGLAVRTHPLGLAAALGDNICPEAKRSNLSVDEHLADVARRHGVHVDGLEDSRTSMDLLSEMPAQARVSLIESTIIDLEKPDACETTNAERQGWATADPSHFEKLDREMRADTSTFGNYQYQVLVRDRDARMAAKLLALLPKQDKIVVAIGAAHLTGAGSVIDTLRSKGVTVERLY